MKKYGEYDKLVKNGKIILDLKQFIDEDEFGDKDNNYTLVGISKEGYLYGFVYINTDENYLVIDNRIIKLRKGTFFYFMSDLNIISYGNGIFTGLLREDEGRKTVLYIYDYKSNKIRYSKNYKYFHNIRYEDGYVTFEGKLENGKYVFVHNLEEYVGYFNKKYLIENLKNIRGKIIIKGKYKKYLPKLDKIISKMSQKKLKNISKKINKLNLNDKKYGKYKNILFYIRYKVTLKLLYNICL